MLPWFVTLQRVTLYKQTIFVLLTFHDGGALGKKMSKRLLRRAVMKTSGQTLVYTDPLKCSWGPFRPLASGGPQQPWHQERGPRLACSLTSLLHPAPCLGPSVSSSPKREECLWPPRTAQGRGGARTPEHTGLLLHTLEQVQQVLSPWG